jgi:hypothetical protein
MRLGAYVEISEALHEPVASTYDFWKRLEEHLLDEFPGVKARLLYVTPSDVDEVDIEVLAKFRIHE